ncbi:MAG: hypothetical protein LRY61_08895 [Burkholderiaceae bacterium]|nr:hypothetical protein [Burkholderiaceae bacterium]MCD8517363.1 hypothetical protein [Burkholderiaceae bacterium]
MRLPRLFAPGQAQLVEVRFLPVVGDHWRTSSDKPLPEKITRWLGEHVRTNGVALHAWSISLRHLLMLATPPDDKALGATVQAIGRHLAAELKTGSIFENRYKSSLIDPEWVLLVQIWLESAPVRDGEATRASAWPWSSAAGHTGLGEPSKQNLVAVSDHECYWACGNTPFDRQANYRARLAEGLTAIEHSRIESALSGQWALGSERYLEQVAKLANRRVAPGKRGRPAKPAEQMIRP